MEVIAILSLCAIGFVVGSILAFIFLPKKKIGILIAGMFFFGVVGFFAAPWVMTAINKTRWAIQDNKNNKIAISEHDYFIDVIENKIPALEFKNHYKNHDISYYGIKKIISDNTITKKLNESNIAINDLNILIKILHKHRKIVERLAFSKKLTSEQSLIVLNSLIEDINSYDYFDFLHYLAKNLETPEEILIKIAVRARPEYLDDVYENKSAPEVVKYIRMIRRYAWMEEKQRQKYPLPPYGNQNHSYVSAWIALATDNQEKVRISVANHPATPAEVLDLLANDTSGDVLCWVLLNKNTTKETKIRIASFTGISNDDYLYKQASNYNWDNDYRKRMAIARYPEINKSILEVSANDTVEDVRYVVAKRRDLSESLCIMLKNDRDSLVRKEIADNPTCSRQFNGKP